MQSQRIRLHLKKEKQGFELYDFDFQSNLDTDMIDDLRTLRFIANNENVIFLGTPLHHSQVVKSVGESYRLKERAELLTRKNSNICTFFST